MKGTYAAMVKREFWEHRALWIAPLVVAGLLICAYMVGALVAARNPPPMLATEFKGMSGLSYGLFSLKVQLFIVAAILAVIYLLDSLYSERKDRSILFWKSLPVSDFQTVISKFAVALVVLPAGTFVLGTLLYPLTYILSTILWPDFPGLTGGWDIGNWLRTEFWLLGCMVVTILWYAPIAAWLMLISVISSRSPYLLVGMPLVVAGVGETMVLRTRHVWEFANWRILPIDSFAAGIQRPGLWIGLAVAAGMLYIVIRVRRYRDDT